MASTVYETDNCFGGASFFHLPAPLRYVTLHFCIRDIARTITGCGQAWYSLQPIITWYPPTQRHLPSLPPSGMHSTISKCSPGQRLLFFKRRWKGVRRQNTPEVSLNFARGLRSDSWRNSFTFLPQPRCKRMTVLRRIFGKQWLHGPKIDLRYYTGQRSLQNWCVDTRTG